MPKRNEISNILIIGSGPIVIGQACEFDYSGVQACIALKEEGYRVVLVNSNPATIMTDPELADVTYIEPITCEVLEKIIETERPDAILPTMGGQTALNCAIELYEKKILEKYAVELIGANYDSIQKAEDREKFKALLEKIGLKTPKSFLASSVAQAREILPKVGLPAIIRPSFTLGGFGGGVVDTEEDYIELCEVGLSLSPQNEIQIDESIYGWKEYELEVVCDKHDNAIVVCSIENIDPVGIHTGDSITVAPAQTLRDKEYQAMRDAAIAIMREVGVDTGGSNVQFAVNPDNGEMLIIEMNPRVSRSSALASKATGYPIARIAAKLAVGYTLDELDNEITSGQTPASFEPAIDYVVTKIPRFDLEKFPKVPDKLGSQMKSVGEVMAIGSTFQASFQKAIVSLEKEFHGFYMSEDITEGVLNHLVETPTPYRFLWIAKAMEMKKTIDEIHQLTKIDPWFLHQMKQLVDIEQKIKVCKLEMLDLQDWYYLKQKGFSDARLAMLFNANTLDIRSARKKKGCLPLYNKIDTCAAEFSSDTDYLYSTYTSSSYTMPAKNKTKGSIVVIGSGPNRIGQGIEFDYCCVHAVQAIKKAGFSAVMINCNPETVSTDYNTSDKLYFDPITFENVMNIIDVEQPKGVVLQFGGQTPLKLMEQLHKNGVPILGSSYDVINKTESRQLFKEMVEHLDLVQPANATACDIDEANIAAKKLGYPLIVRPSYVIGGRAMKIIQNESELENYFNGLEQLTFEFPILLECFIENAIEIDVDAICDGSEVIVCGVLEHIESAGVHSGDSACVFPSVSISTEIENKIKQQIKKIAFEIGVVGLINGQFAIKNDQIYIIEINARASRTLPFISKATGTAWVNVALNCMLEKSLKEQAVAELDKKDFYAVKESVFPFNKLSGSLPFLSPEMKSTGEVMGIGNTFEEAFYKAQNAAGFGHLVKDKKLILLAGLDAKHSTQYGELFTLISTFNMNIVMSESHRDAMRQYADSPIDYMKDKKIKKLLSDCDIALILSFATCHESDMHYLQLGIKQGIHYATTPDSAKIILHALNAVSTGEIMSIQKRTAYCA